MPEGFVITHPDQVVEMDPERLESRRVVCSAVKHPKTGQMWFGPRHAHCLWQVPKSINNDTLVQGFVDQFLNFLTREEAWNIAKKQGQILRLCGTEGGERKMLFSEHLY